MPGYLLGAIGCLAGEDHTILDARQSQKPTQAGDCVLRETFKKKYFSGFCNLFWFRGLGKLQNCSNRWLKRAADTFQIRLRELRRLQTRQKGGSGLPKELPRLLPKATVDIGGAAFGRLWGGNYPNLDATWSPKQTRAGDCVLSQNIAKPMFVLVFISLFASGGSKNREIAATDG